MLRTGNTSANIRLFVLVLLSDNREDQLFFKVIGKNLNSRAKVALGQLNWGSFFYLQRSGIYINNHSNFSNLPFCGIAYFKQIKQVMRAKKENIRPNIAPLIIRGEREFAAAFGISDGHTQARLRDRGLPCYHDGKCFVYFPDEVVSWMKENWKINLPDNT